MENPLRELEWPYGWRGISAPTTLTIDREGQRWVEGYVAVTGDESSGEVAVSVWEDQNGYGQRHIAMWLSPAAARNLARELITLADDLEANT